MQIICLTHNLLKLFQARTAPANRPKNAESRSKSGELAYVRRKGGFLLWSIRCAAQLPVVLPRIQRCNQRLEFHSDSS